MHETLLHLGVRWDDLLTLRALLHPSRATLAGDRWDAWGEPLETSPPTPFAHVIVRGPSEEHGLSVTHVAHLLCGDPAGSWIAAETTLDDWNIEDAGGRIWHRLDGDAGGVIVIEVHPWRDGPAATPPPPPD